MKFINRKMSTMTEDIVWQVGCSIINRVSFFVALLLLSSYMSATNYGVFGLIYNISLSISSVLSCGLGIVTRRELVGKYNTKQQTILSSNIIIIIALNCLCTGIISIYHMNTNNIDLNSIVFFVLLFLLSINASISHYLNYHYSGLTLYKEYNKILLPINVILPISLLVIQPSLVPTAVLVISIVVLIGNLWQIAYLNGFTRNLDFGFQKDKHTQFFPCFLQALLGLPVYVILQMIIVERWNDISLIGLILIATQILNMCNIFATKSLTVFSVSITKALNTHHGIVPIILFLKYFMASIAIIVSVHLVIWIALPLIISSLKNNLLNAIYDLRYFVVVNIIISTSWFFVEYLHAIKKSWVSFMANTASSVGIFLIFFIAYYQSSTFSLVNYANCLAFARIIPILICGYYIIKSSRKLLS